MTADSGTRTATLKIDESTFSLEQAVSKLADIGFDNATVAEPTGPAADADAPAAESEPTT